MNLRITERMRTLAKRRASLLALGVPFLLVAALACTTTDAQLSGDIRQEDRQADRQVAEVGDIRQEDRQADRQADRQVAEVGDIRQEDRQADRQADRQLGRQEDRRADRQADRQLGRQEDRQADRGVAEVGEDAGFSGTIESMSADFVVIGGKTFKVDGTTMLDNGLGVGVVVRVEFIAQADGSMLATEIETGVSGDGEVEIEHGVENEVEHGVELELEDDGHRGNSGSGSSGPG